MFGAFTAAFFSIPNVSIRILYGYPFINTSLKVMWRTDLLNRCS